MKRMSKIFKRNAENSHRFAFDIRQDESEESEYEDEVEEELETGVEEEDKSKAQWRILITGGSGHLAENLVKKIVNNIREEMRPLTELEVETSQVALETDPKEMAKNYKLKVDIALNRKMSSCVQFYLLDLIQPSDELTEKDYITFICGSFTDFEIMRYALKDVHTVFHLAAVGMTGLYATNRKACMDINAVGTMNLLSWCRQLQVQRFVYSSSIGVLFNGKPLNNVTEEQKHADKFYNYYCESKAHAEIIVQNASCGELKTAVLRFNGIYGPGEKRVTERVVNFMTSGWWIGICKPNGVEAQTQLSSVDNCVQGLIRAEVALRDPHSPHGEVYNIMDRDPVGTFTFWTPLNKALGFEDEMMSIPPIVLKFGGWICQKISNWSNFDPFINSLEVDLLIVNNTFSIKKACDELGYIPFPSSMPEIIEMYKNKENPKWRITPHFLMGTVLPCFVILIVLIILYYYSTFDPSDFL